MNAISIVDIVALAIGLVVLLAWLFLFFKGKEHESLFEGLNNEDYPLHELYFVGFAATLLLKLEYKTKSDRNLRKELSSLYEAKYADYYMRVVYAQGITMGLTIMCLAAPTYCMTGNIALFALLIAAGPLAFIYYKKATKDLIEKKKEEYLSDFSDVVSKLALLVGSGMILTEAWERVSVSSDEPIYQEMKRSVEMMRNGHSATEAFNMFGQRCMLSEIRKFTTTLIQGIMRGNSELAPMLKQQSSEVWAAKKQEALRKGALANDTLLVPMFMTFIGILIMIMVPIFSNMGV